MTCLCVQRVAPQAANLPQAITTTTQGGLQSTTAGTAMRGFLDHAFPQRVKKPKHSGICKVILVA